MSDKNQKAFTKGYKKGFTDGFSDGFTAGFDLAMEKSLLMLSDLTYFEDDYDDLCEEWPVGNLDDEEELFLDEEEAGETDAGEAEDQDERPHAEEGTRGTEIGL